MNQGLMSPPSIYHTHTHTHAHTYEEPHIRRSVGRPGLRLETAVALPCKCSQPSWGQRGH